MSQTLEELLQALDTESARLMLEDLKDPQKRTPQLYNAIGKLLDRHKFAVSKVQPDADVLGELADALPDGVLDSDLYTTLQ